MAKKSQAPSLDEILAAAAAEEERQLLADLSPAEQEALRSFAAQVGEDFRRAVESFRHRLADLRRRLETALALPRRRPLAAEAERLSLHLQRFFAARRIGRALGDYIEDTRYWARPFVEPLTPRDIFERLERDVATVEAAARECAGTPAQDSKQRALEAMRRAIQETSEGANAKTEALCKRAGISRKDALDALRELQRLGEYRGHSYRKSPRWKKPSR
jgi:hypothetical protein